MAIPSRIILYQLNDQELEVDRLRVRRTGVYLNAATVTATLYDNAGSPVTGVNGLSLSYVAASNGKYIATIEDTFAPALGDNYEIWIDAVEGSAKAHFEIPVSVMARSQ